MKCKDCEQRLPLDRENGRPFKSRCLCNVQVALSQAQLGSYTLFDENKERGKCEWSTMQWGERGNRVY
jgi:hypothetical protein